MKRQSTLDVSLDGQLKVKRCTIIHTGQSLNQRVEKDNEDEMVQCVYHVAVEKVDEDELSEEDIKEAPPQLKDWRQAIVDDLT